MRTLDIVCDGPPGPDGGRFVEVEIDGVSVRAGTWEEDVERGLWRLRIPLDAGDGPRFDEFAADLRAILDRHTNATPRPAPAGPPRLLSTREAAARLGLRNPETIRRWCQCGRLAGAFRLGGGRGRWRIPAATIDDAVANGRPPRGLHHDAPDDAETERLLTARDRRRKARRARLHRMGLDDTTNRAIHRVDEDSEALDEEPLEIATDPTYDPTDHPCDGCESDGAKRGESDSCDHCVNGWGGDDAPDRYARRGAPTTRRLDDRVEGDDRDDEPPECDGCKMLGDCALDGPTADCFVEPYHPADIDANAGRPRDE